MEYIGPNIDTDVVLYKKQHDKPKPVGPATIYNTGLTDYGELQYFLYDVDLNCGSGSVFIVMKAVVIKRYSFPIAYPS